jgi:hypothetical protein
MSSPLDEKYKKATYLGDGLYALDDGDTLVLFSSNGIEVLNEVHLEPGVIESMVRFLERSRGLKITAVRVHFQRDLANDSLV